MCSGYASSSKSDNIFEAAAAGVEGGDAAEELHEEGHEMLLST